MIHYSIFILHYWVYRSAINLNLKGTHMKSYILTLLSASLAAAVVELLAPKGEGGRLASHIRMIAGLFLLVALLTPLREGIRLLREAADGDLSSRVEALIPSDMETDYEAVFGDNLAAIGSDEVKAWVLQAMETRFGIPAEGCTVRVACSYGEETLTVTELRISLTPAYLLHDPHPIEAYFTEQLDCPCSVTVAAP